MNNKVIYKYELERVKMYGERDRLDHLILPHEAQPTLVGYDPKFTLCLWAIVDPTAPRCQHEIEIVGTGQPIPTDKMFVGTAVEPRDSVVLGNCVWHVFIGQGVPLEPIKPVLKSKEIKP